MDNSTQTQLQTTTVNGTLLGYPTVVTYTNTTGVAPASVTLLCDIVEATDRLTININCTRDEIWNISANMTGHKSLADILALVEALETEVLNTIAATAIPA